MFRKNPKELYDTDSKIVRSDYIVAKAITNAYSFSNNEGNPFSRGLNLPMLFLWKVHKNHPLRITNRNGYTRVWPAENYDLFRDRKRRMPARIFEDKMAHDLATFMLIPFKFIQNKPASENCLYFDLGKSFIPCDRGKEPSDATLFYAAHGNSISPTDDIYNVSAQVMPSHLKGQIWDFLINGGNIYSHEKTFGSQLEGQVKSEPSHISGLFTSLCSLLEKRYNSRLV